MVPSLPVHLLQFTLALLIGAGPLPILYWIAPRLTSFRTAERITAYLSVWCAVQTIVGQGLGYVGAFDLQSILAVYAGLWMAYGIIWWRMGRRERTLGARPDHDRRLLIIGALLATLALGLIVTMTVKPVTEYDSLSYHLPAVAQWYSTHSLMLDRWGVANYYPYGWEVISAMFVVPLQGDDALVLVPNVLAWVLYGLGAWSVARRLSAAPLYAAGALSVLVTLPIVLEQMATLRVDLAFGAFCLTAVAFILVYRQSGDTTAFWLAAVSMGLVLGTKTSGIAYVGLLLFWLTYSLWRVSPLQSTKRVGWLAMTLGLILLIGGSWYARDWLEAGNPLAPMSVAVGDHVIWPGEVASAEASRTTLAALFDVARPEDRQVLSNVAADKIGWPMLGLVTIGLAGFAVHFFRDRSFLRSDARWIASLILITAVLYWLTPYSGDNGSHNWQITPWIGQALRYGLPFLGLVAALSVIGWQLLRLPEQVVLALMLFNLGWVLSEFSMGWLLLGGALSVVAMAWPRIFQVIQRWPKRRWAGAFALGLLAAGLFGAYGWRQEHAAQRAGAYGSLATWIDANVKPNDVVGYMRVSNKYALYGSRLDRSTRYVRPGQAATAAEWLTNLRNLKVAWFAIGPLRPEWGEVAELDWLQDEANFTRALGEDVRRDLVIYAVKAGQ
jgi:hypothetical protein